MAAHAHPSPLTEAAAQFLLPELELRTRFLVQEASKVARQAHRGSRMLPLHVEVARELLAGRGGRPALVWAPHPGAAAARLFVSDAAAPFSSPVAADGGADASVDAGSREAAAVLAAVSASISGSGGAQGVALLLAQLGARDASQLRFLLPAVIVRLRDSVEESLVAGVASGAADGTAHVRQLLQMQRVLRVVAALAANAALPLEQGPAMGELLATSCSVLLHQAASPAQMHAQVQTERVQQEEVRTRAYAAKVVGALVERAAALWPDVCLQASDVLLDALAAAVEAGPEAVGPPTSSSEQALRGARVLSFEGLFGAACGLACLPAGAAPPKALPLAAFAQSVVQELRDGSREATPATKQWHWLCAEALARALRRLGSGIGGLPEVPEDALGTALGDY